MTTGGFVVPAALLSASITGVNSHCLCAAGRTTLNCCAHVAMCQQDIAKVSTLRETYTHPSICCMHHCREHCMLAASNISENQVLLQVPKALFMTADNALKSKHCGSLIKREKLSEWQVRLGASISTAVSLTPQPSVTACTSSCPAKQLCKQTYSRVQVVAGYAGSGATHIGGLRSLHEMMCM